MRQWLAALLPYVTSAIVHVVVGGGLAAGTLFVAKKLIAPEPVQVELVVVPRKKLEKAAEPDPTALKEYVDAPTPEVQPKPKRREKPKVQRTLTELPDQPTPRIERLAAAPLAPPANPQEPVREGPAAPAVFGLTMDSADTGGGTFSVSTGNTLATNPRNTGVPTGPRGRPPPSGLVPPPKEKRKPRIETAPEFKISKWPSRKDNLVFRYPEEARRNAIEGAVKMRLSIDATGQVADARVTSPGEKVLDDFALANVTRLLFAPAEAGGQAVACEIPFTFTFVLD